MPEQKKPLPAKKPQPQWFVVQMEVLAPVFIEYRVLATNEAEAFQAAEKRGPNTHLNSQPKIDFSKMRKIKAKVKGAYNNIISWTKTF